MDEGDCVITYLNERVSVTLCSTHSYGTDMLLVLRRLFNIFSVLAASTDTHYEAQTLLQKVEREQIRRGKRPTRQTQINKV